MASNCCLILTNGNINSGWIFTSSFNNVIFCERGVWHNFVFQVVKFENSTWWHLITLRFSSWLNCFTSCLLYNLWHFRYITKLWNCSFSPKMFFVIYKESKNLSKSAPLISVKTSFKNLINNSVAIPDKLNLVQKFIIHSNIHRN